jgi:diacylglycerol kinase family enzyme
MSAERAFNLEGLPEAYPSTPDVVGPLEHAYPLTGYDRLVILRNPNSSRAHSHLGDLQALEEAAGQYGLNVETYDTSPHFGGNTATLQRAVSASTIIGVRTGDGGLGEVLGDARAIGLQNPVLAMPGGRKNDIATSLGADQLLRDPSATLQHAHIREVRPIVVSFGAEGEEPTVRDAYGYASIGISSLVAARMNDPNYRRSRLLHVPGGRYVMERLITARTFMGAQPVSVEYPDGATEPALDIIAANGNLMAGSLHPRADLLEHNFRLITARRKLGALAVLGGMMLGAPVGETVEAGERRSLTLTVPEDLETYLQVDGEHHRLRGRVVVSLTMAATGVNLLVPTPRDSLITAA